MTAISYRDGISIAEIIIYLPALFISIFLCIKHGFGRSAGWYFLIIFCLARIIGPGMQLGTINDPDNLKLYEGSSILNNVGLSPLELAAIGLLSRLLDNIHRTTKTILDTRMLKFIELIIIVALILGIVGGVDAANSYATTFHYVPGNLNKAGTALFIVSWVLLTLAVILVSPSVSLAEHGERRLFTAVAISIPLLLIRLAYSIGSTYKPYSKFNLLSGSPTYLLCIALIEEFIIVVVFLGVGLTLKKVNPIQHVEAGPAPGQAQAPVYHQNGTSTAPVQGQAPAYHQNGAGYAQTEPKKQNIVLRILSYTIIGRIINSAMSKKEVSKEQGGY